jgi:hypothetical protein
LNTSNGHTHQLTRWISATQGVSPMSGPMSAPVLVAGISAADHSELGPSLSIALSHKELLCPSLCSSQDTSLGHSYLIQRHKSLALSHQFGTTVKSMSASHLPLSTVA